MDQLAVIIGIGLIAFLASIAVGLNNLNQLRREGYLVKNRVYTHAYLGGHPDLRDPKNMSIIYPKEKSLYIFYFPNSNLFKLPIVGGIIPYSNITRIIVEKPANFLIIEWNQGTNIYNTTFQFSPSSIKDLELVRDKLCKIIKADEEIKGSEAH